MKQFLFNAFLLMFSLSVVGQPYGDAAYKQKFTKADALMYDGSHAEALPLLEDLHASDSTIANINYMIGVCHLLGTKKYHQAIRYLENATRDVSKDYSEANWKERKAPGITFLQLGRAYHYINQFDRAVSNYYNYRSFIEIDDIETYNKVRLVIKHAENAIELIANPVDAKIVNLGANVNTQFPEYAPVISADGEMLIFTSRRPGGTSDAKNKDGSYYDDIYLSRISSGGAWEKPTRIPGVINTIGHEAAIGISSDGRTLFIYKDDNGDGNIYYSELKGSEWTAPMKMGSDINTVSWETHATVSSDGDMLIFTSNRPGGHGARDLWYCLKLPDGSWGLAQNMGSVINTQFDEESPFLGFDGKTLFFSSQGHTSMGGFDIFRSEMRDGTWSEPENLGYPINTADEDVFFVLSADGRNAYYSSRREGGFGETDLYALRIDPKKAESMAVARGEMLVPANDYVKLKANIIVKDKSGSEVGTYRPNPNSGYYVLLLNPGEAYSIEYKVEGYEPIQNVIPVAQNTAYTETFRPIDLPKVVFGPELLALQEQKRKAEEEAVLLAAKAAEQQLLAEQERAKAEEEARAMQERLAQEEENRKEVEKASQQALAEAQQAEQTLKAEQLNAEQAAEALRKAENDAQAQLEEKARLEAEKLATELKLKEAAAEMARQEADAAAKAKAESERLAAENKLKEASEEKARQEAEAAAKAKAAESERLAAELKLKEASEEKARQETEAAAKAKAAESERLAAELKLKEAAGEKARQEAEAAAKAKAAESERLAAENKLKEASEEKAQQEAEAAAKAKAAESERLAAEQKLKEAAEEKARQEAEAAAKAKAAESERLAVEKKSKEASEEKARQEAEAAAKAKAAESERLVAELKLKEAAEEKSRQEVEAAAKAKAEQAERVAADQKLKEASSKGPIDEEALKREQLRKRLEELRQKKQESEAALAAERAMALKKIEEERLAEKERQLGATEEGQQAARELEVDQYLLDKQKQQSEKKVPEQPIMTEAELLKFKQDSIAKQKETQEWLKRRLKLKDVDTLSTSGAKSPMELNKADNIGTDTLAQKRLAEEDMQRKTLDAALAKEQELIDEQEAKVALLNEQTSLEDKKKIEEDRLQKEVELEKQRIAEDQRIQREKAEKDRLAAEEERKIVELERQRVAEEQKRAEAATTMQQVIAGKDVQAKLESLVKENQRLSAENREIRSQLSELSDKLDVILAELSSKNARNAPVANYDEDAVSALNSGKGLILQNILFDYNKARLRGNSERELDKLHDVLKDNPDIRITVSGHTDAVGEADYNLRLSRSRAEAVVEYLVSKGIPANRLKAVGFGQTRPIARNVNPDGSDNPLGRQLNRRIEISILGGDSSLIRTEEMAVPEDARLRP